MKNDPVLAALNTLDDVPLRTPEGLKQIAKALAAKSNLVVAKAARIAGESQWTELSDDLVKAFDRLVKRGAEADKGCAAMNAIARALYALDYDGADLYLAGMHHVQREAGYLRPTDTAVELRAVCAMGLASTNYRHKMRELVDLLSDSEWQARAGAVRAIATVGSEAAALLLRLKTHLGDEEPDVLAECFAGMIGIEGADALPLIISFAESGEVEVRDASILALGASRRADAVDWLKERFGRVADMETRQSILLALATSRTEAAIEFVLEVIRQGNEQSSAVATAAMEVNRGDSRIRGEMEKALRERRV
jgi:HEAT repeat protein